MRVNSVARKCIKMFLAGFCVSAALLPYIQRWMQHCEYIIQVEKSILHRRGIIADDYCRKPGWTLTHEDNKTIDRFIQQFSLSS
ncbi:hypothetical protein [Citrobacter amalonaticus]|uniref:hypothetical protein n=1 Tax=Citrobacter amalonaticus TaxID=35703 RepID=UPI0021564FAD|nr:hypothetical protein [Citrobacter amalonaticus]